MHAPRQEITGGHDGPRGEDHVKVQASLGCKRNIIRPLVQSGRRRDQGHKGCTGNTP